MRTQPAFLLLGALLFAPTLLLLHAQHPGRAMRPFGSDAELLQYLAVIDRARPSRQAPADRTCSDTTRLKPGDKQVVITGRVSDTAGYAIANAQVYAVGRCTTSGADGKYRLELPDGALRDRSRVRVAAAFIGYRQAVRDVTVRRRAASADFKLTAAPVQLEEASVVSGMASAMDAKDESITNTQHAGVDEGGIVKLHGDHLVVLRRGRLFTVSVRAGELRPVATVDAYPAGAEPAEWYDEMLVEGDRVIVIGYSYRRGGTEVSLFAIDDRAGSGT